MFICVSVIIGCFFSVMAQKTRVFRVVPYTVSLLFAGMVAGAANLSKGSLGYFGNAVDNISNMDPHLFLLIFLPALIFESAFSVNFHIIKREASQALTLAGPGVIISMILTAVVARYVFDYNWSWTTSLMFGAIMAATDPVAVVALLREVGASKRLATLIEAESLFNDGTSFVFFLIWKDFVVGKSRDPGEVTRFLVRLSVGGAGLGLGIGVVAVAFLAHTFNNPIVETSITISTAYFTFWLAESNDIGLHVSGVLATVILGLTLSRYKSYISVASEETLHAFWRVVGWLINTLIFFISGIFVAQKLFSGSDHLSMVDFGWLLVLYAFLHLIRGTTIALLSPFMRKMGYGFELNTGIVLMWGGLRGAVGLALALIVDLDEGIAQSIKDRVLFHVAGVVLLTIAINGSTTGLLLRRLGMTDAKGPERRAFRQALATIADESDETTIRLRKMREYESADWEVVARMLPQYERKARSLLVNAKWTKTFDLDDEEVRSIGRERKRTGLMRSPSAGDAKLSREDIREEMYHRLLTAVKASFWEHYEKGLTTQEAIAILDEAAETARDRHSLRELWSTLETHFYIPWHFGKLENCWPWLAQKLLLRRLSLAVELALAFREACCAADHLDDFFRDFGDEETFSSIKREVHQLRKRAETAWLETQASFPRLWVLMQTEKASRLVLKTEEKAICRLHQEGVLLDREYELMRTMVAEATHFLYTHPPKVRITREADVLEEMCFWRYTSRSIRNRIAGTRRHVFNKGDRVRDERSTGLHIVVKGLVSVRDRVTSRHVNTLSISDFLGMWGVCTGQPSLGVAFARSQPVIVAHITRSVCNDILKTRVGPYWWKLACVDILQHRFPQHIHGISRYRLVKICMAGEFHQVDSCSRPRLVAVEWPTVLMVGRAQYAPTSESITSPFLIDPQSPPRQSHVAALLADDKTAPLSSDNKLEDAKQEPEGDAHEVPGRRGIPLEKDSRDPRRGDSEAARYTMNSYIFDPKSIYVVLAGFHSRENDRRRRRSASRLSRNSRLSQAHHHRVPPVTKHKSVCSWTESMNAFELLPLDKKTRPLPVSASTPGRDGKRSSIGADDKRLSDLAALRIGVDPGTPQHLRESKGAASPQTPLFNSRLARARSLDTINI